MMKIFISHSSKDKPFAKKLANDFIENGYDCWLDEWQIDVGDSIVSKIQQGIKESDYLILILSNSSVNSQWVENEWKIKYWDEIANKKNLILPVLIEDCEIPFLLREKKYADFRDDYSSGLQGLIKVIKKKQFYKNEGLFLWSRYSNEVGKHPVNGRCAYCNTTLIQVRTSYASLNAQYTPVCPLCGWHYLDCSHTDWGGYEDCYFVPKALKYFDLTETDIPFKELATYLKKNRDKIFRLNWRGFENLVADIYKDLGYYVTVTQPSNDEKSDLILMENGKKTTIIHCEKLPQDKKVSITSFRSLLGASIDLGLKRAKLVTTTNFEDEVKQRKDQPREKEIAIDLVGGDDLFVMLGVYNEALPKIEHLKESDLVEIIENSKAKYESL